MNEFLSKYGWEMFKWIMGAAGAVGVWALKQYSAKQDRLTAAHEEHGKRITELEKQVAVHQARHDTWRELGAPERRKR